MSGFYQAGGVSALLKVLLTNMDFTDISGVTRLKTSEFVDSVYIDTNVIHNFDNPFTTKSGLGILRGNIAPEGSVIKISAVDE